MHISIFLLLDEESVVREIKLIRMLKYEICTWVQYVMSEDLVRNGRKIFQCIRGISKYDIELFPADIEELEYIVPYDSQIVHAEPDSLRFDEVRLHWQHFHS